MINNLRSSASTSNRIQGILDEPGNSSTKLAGYMYGIGKYGEDMVLEVYNNGVVIGDPYSDTFSLDWIEEVGDVYYTGFYFHDTIPELDPHMLLSDCSCLLFKYDGNIYIKYGHYVASFLYDENIFFYAPQWNNSPYNLSRFICNSHYLITQLCINSLQRQSGVEYNEDLFPDYKYSKSKSRLRWKNSCVIQDKLIKTKQLLNDANLGSRKKKTKKNLDKKIKTNHARIKMQSGVELNVSNITTFIEKMIGIFLLKYYDHPLYIGLSSVLLLFKSSISMSLYEYVMDIIRSVKDCKGTFSDFNNWLKDLVVDLDKFKNNKFASSFVELILKIWTTFLCPSILLEWSKDILEKTIGKILSCFTGVNNPIESVIWAITYVVNGIDVFIKDGTMEGFLTTETLTDTLSNRVRVIRQDFKLYLTGDLEFIKGFKQYAFLSSVEKLRKDLQAIRKSKRGIDLKQVDEWLKEVDNIELECQRLEAQTGSRIQPYHFLLISGSGISKSHLLKLFAYTIAKSNNIPCEEEYVYYLNQANKFQSGWSNYKSIVMVDDSAAMHADSPTSSNYLDLADWVLRSDNNVPHELLAADVKEKGALFNKSLVQGWASNSFTQEFEKRARFASAINRRIQVRIVGEVRPEYVQSNRDRKSKSTRIDYSKLPEDQRSSICPDAWLFTCYECEIEDLGVSVKEDFIQPVSEHDALHRYVKCLDYNGKEMSKRNLGDTLKFLKWHSELHFANQKKVLDVGNKVYDSSNYCDHGLPIGINCDECNALTSQFPVLQLDTIEETSCITGSYDGEEDDSISGIENTDAISNDVSTEKNLCTTSNSSLSTDNTESLCNKLNISTGENVFREKRWLFKERWSRNTNRIDEESMPALMKLTSYKQNVIHHVPCYSTYDTIYHTLLCQSGTEKRIKYCKVLLDKLNDMRINNIGSKILSSTNLLHDVREIACSIKSVLSDWFSGMVCDLISYFCDKFFDYVEKFIMNPLQFIPVSLEDTMLSEYMYSKHPILRLTMICDYAHYLFNYPIMNYGLHTTKHSFSCDYTRAYYDKFIRTRTPLENSIKEYTEPMSFSSFAKRIVSNISKCEKDIKTDFPDMVRDMLVPLGLSFVTITSFIPHLVTQLSSLYCEVQVGYDMTVEQVKEADSLTKQEWYKNKHEVFLSKPSVNTARTYTELETIVAKNTFFVRNTANKKIVSALSFANQYLIMPYHFVSESIGNVLQCVKTEIPSYDTPGNAIVEFQLDDEMVYKLPGDACVIYLEKCMDHMRTRDLLNSFVNEPLLGPCVGRLLYKQSLGKFNLMEARTVQYTDIAHNNTPHDGPFKGYYYYSKNFMGLCGGVLVDESRKISSILGIHVGGNETTGLSVACAIMRSDLEAALEYFSNGVALQSGIDFKTTWLEGYTPDIYKHNPFLDTVDRLDGVELLGTAKVRYSYDNKVVYTNICEDVKKIFNVDYTFVAPTFKFDNDKRHGVRQLIRAYSRKSVLRDKHILKLAQKDLRNQFLYPLEKELYWRKEIRLLNDFEVVNGVLGKRFLGGMNMATAFGGGYTGNKSKYAKQLDDNTWRFEDWVMKKVSDYEASMDAGIIVPDVVTQQLKLEATDIAKASIGKVRSFFMSSTIIQIVIRRLLLTTCRYACMNTKYTEMVIGINAHSTDWTKFVIEITKFGKNRMVALDLENMDATVLFEVLSGCIDIFFSPFNIVCNKEGKYTNRLAVLKHLLLFPLVDVHGDLVCMSGMLPSGTPLTSMMGCLINSTYYRMAFYYLYNGTRVFSDLVTLRVYGDDSVANVSKEATFFNTSTILKSWLSLGIRGTDMEKKGRESRRKYYKLEEIEFLKRKMVYNKDFGVVVAPLLKKSMFKCLMCHVPPRTVTLEYLTGQCIDNFLFEAKFHGREYYETSRRRLRSIATKHDLLRFCNMLDVSYSELVEKWKVENSDSVLVTEQWRKCQPLWFRLASSFNFDIQNWSVWTQSTLENTINDDYRSVVKPGVALDGAQLTVQSGVESDVQQVVTFLEGNDDNKLEIGSNTATSRISGDPVSLGDFLKRPVMISSFDWGTDPVFFAIDPWRSLLYNKRISNRISNYNLFKAKCHVKFVINGNGFFYGRIMVSYLPFAESGIARPVNATLSGEDTLVTISQMPKVFLDPTTSKGAEMILPFFYPYSYLSLSEPYAARDLGTLYFNTIANLKHANQNIAVTTEKVTITVYAWFEDVELQGPTSLNITGLTPQSGREEEDVDKPISQMATNVANVASAVKNIPVLGPYALAVEKGARVTSNIASALGYCKPTAVPEPLTYIPRPFDSLAITNTTSSVCKLSLDVKQDTSISPLEVNLGNQDQLSFNYISQRDSYLNQFTWPTTTGTGSALMSYLVMPNTYRRSTNRLSMTAVCGVANCFKYWTGSLVYRFQIIKSAYHRGRLAVVYDPRETRITREDNINFSHIIDIGETSDFEITISNYQEREWMSNTEGWYNVPCFTSGAISLGGINPAYLNGVITLYVLNELTTPNSDPTLNTDIRIACYVRAGPDFQVADPLSVAQWTTVEPQSGEEKSFNNATVAVDDTGDGIRDIQHYNEMEKDGNKLYMGEVVSSFRTLLKRDNCYVCSAFNNTSVIDYMTHAMYPLYPDLANDCPTAGNNRVLMTMINYVRLAFIGYKGSIRWKISLLSPADTMILVARDESNTTVFETGSYAWSTINTFISNASATISNRMGRGAVLSNYNLNPNVEFEMPYYSTNKFLVSSHSSSASSTFEKFIGTFTYTIFKNSSTSISRNVYSMLVSAGEDFTCYCFVGWPPIYLR